MRRCNHWSGAIRRASQRNAVSRQRVGGRFGAIAQFFTNFLTAIFPFAVNPANNVTLVVHGDFFRRSDGSIGKTLVIGASDVDGHGLRRAVGRVYDEAVSQRITVVERLNRRIAVVERVAPIA